MRVVSRRAAKLPARGRVRRSARVGNSGGRACVGLRGAAVPPRKARSTCCGYSVIQGVAASRWLPGRRGGDAGGGSARCCPGLGLTHGVHVDSGWLRRSACLRACDSAAVPLPPNHRISRKLNQHPQTRVLRCGELYPECHRLGLFFFKISFSLKSLIF